MSAANNWWRGAVLYQIYPRSFKDSTSKGTGDLNGITDKLEYIASLGVHGIWISPFLQSPQTDYGYDISDYRAIDPLFGTMEDFEALLDKAHSLNLKIIMDMVLSHTSDQHSWFKESRLSRNNPKADWYVWADEKADGSPPNNWVSVFGGSAWEYCEERKQYYLHNFLKSQPDLNYHNPDVQAAMIDTCRFWLDKGADGLRLDVINFCFHDAELRDNPPRSDGGSATQLEFPDPYSEQRHIYDKSRPENLEFIRKLRTLTDEYPGRFTLAEIGDDDAVKTSAAYTADESLLHTAYSFEMMTSTGTLPAPSFFRAKIEAQKATKGDSWPSWAFSNHDVIRAASRWSGTKFDHDPRLSKLLPILLCSLRGTAFIYQGEELGLPEGEIPYERLQDPWGKHLWPKWQGRDGCRTPMPWDGAAKNAGFSNAEETWLPIPQSHLPLSVSAQETDQHSTLNTVRNFLNWRTDQSALKEGDIAFIDGLPPGILGFIRKDQTQNIACYFNLSEIAQILSLHDTLIYSAENTKKDGQEITLAAYGFAFTANQR